MLRVPDGVDVVWRFVRDRFVILRVADGVDVVGADRVERRRFCVPRRLAMLLEFLVLVLVLCERSGRETILRTDEPNRDWPMIEPERRDEELRDLVIVPDDGVRVIGADRDGVLARLVLGDEIEGRVACGVRIVLRLVIRRVRELPRDRLESELDRFDTEGVREDVMDRVLLVDGVCRLPRMDRPPRYVDEERRLMLGRVDRVERELNACRWLDIRRESELLRDVLRRTDDRDMDGRLGARTERVRVDVGLEVRLLDRLLLRLEELRRKVRPSSVEVANMARAIRRAITAALGLLLSVITNIA